MPKGKLLVAGVAVLGGLGMLAIPLRADAEPTTSSIVVLKRSAHPETAIASLARTYGIKLEHSYTASIHGFAARLSRAQRTKLASEPAVADVRDDREIRLVPAVRGARKADTPTGVRRIGAGTTTASVAVAVIDTGIDLRYPALNAKTGVNCVSSRRSTPAQDDNGHGTHVAGTIAARAGSGVAGVAPGTQVIAVKVLDARGAGTVARVICGIDWVTANAKRLGIAVANLSFGGPGWDDGDCGATNGDPLHEAICRSTEAGVTYVVAAGNDGIDLANAVPAAYREVLAVTAIADSDGRAGGAGGAPACMGLEHDDTPATFSNYATTTADASHVIAAPGVCITSTWPGGGTNTISGTSMAAPHVTGVIALCISSGHCPRDPTEAIRTVVTDARRHGTDANGFTGDGVGRGGRRYGYLVWGGA